DLERGGGGGAGGDADEDAFLGGQPARGGDGVVVADVDQLVVGRAVEHLRHEVRRPALDLVRLPLVALQQRGAGRLGGDDAHVRARDLEHFAHPGQGAAAAPAADEGVQPPAGEVAQDLGGGGLAVVGGVGRVGELAGQEPAVLRRQFLRLVDHAGAARGGRGQDHLGAVGTHGLAAF